MAKELAENLEKITSKYFDQSLVDQAFAYYESSTKDSSKANELKLAIKAAYKAVDANLKTSIKEQIKTINENTQKELASIEETKISGVNNENDRFAKISNPSKDEKKEHSNVLNGVNIVAKRAKIKAKNSNYEERKAAKLQRYEAHVEYVNLMFYMTKKISPVDNLRSRVFEDGASFDVKRALTNKETWANLIPLFMLGIMIVLYFVARQVFNYNGKIETIINSGIFVAVVASGAVFIYSQGGFDMSLGNASLLCALLAGTLYISDNPVFHHNLALSLLVAVVVGAILGIINAVLATMLGLPVMVMTLTMMNILAAINDAIIGGKLFDLRDELGEGMISSPWIYAAFLLVFFVICWFIFNYTKVGRRNKFIGSNKVAAKYNGINLMKAGIISFAISGIGLGICGFIFINSKAGENFNPASSVLNQVGLNVIIAIVFGGMTTSGGPKSKVSCAIIGAFFVVFLEEFFNAINASYNGFGDYKYLAKGVIFIIVALANMWDTRTKRLASGGSIQ